MYRVIQLNYLIIYIGLFHKAIGIEVSFLIVDDSLSSYVSEKAELILVSAELLFGHKLSLFLIVLLNCKFILTVEFFNKLSILFCPFLIACLKHLAINSAI